MNLISIWDTDINCMGKRIKPGQIFEVGQKNQEIENLISNGYLEEIE